MDEKLTELADTIQLAQGGGLDSALVIVKTDAGRRAMDILRGEMQEFKAEESRLLRLRQSELAASQRNTRILFGDPRYSEYLEDINKSGMLLLSLINVVLDLAKIEAGKFELLEERVDLQSFLLSSVELISLQARERQIDLTFHAQEDFPNLQCDPRTLAQIINNLLSNAIKFTEANGSVTVSTLAAQDGAILIRVEDSGIGMDEDGIKRALEPFGRVDSALTRSQEGTGLGLHVSKLLIERQGGSLDIESSPGEGTTVTARFPPERALAIGQNALAG